MRKITACLLIAIVLLSLSTSAFAWSPVDQHDYSSEANSGIRDEVCTTLDGTSVGTYYTGDYTFETLSALSGDALLQSLRTLMKSTHTYQTSYSECRDYSVITDCEKADGETINLLYTSYVVTMAEYINNATDGGGWNREHVWPKSLGGFNTSGAGADLHHIRPTDKSVNGQRGNEKYGIPTNGHQVQGTVTVENAVGGLSDNTYFEPLDDVKGDVARICLYVWARYGGELSKCSSITNVFQSIDILLEWHEADPVDTWEMGRNEVVYAIQGNRNVFIDYPELAWLVFDREIPADIATPSGSTVSCEHANVEHRNAKEPTCTEEGHTGDVYCADCGRFVAGGSVIPTKHVNTEIRGAWEATCKQAGCTGDIYCKDCGKLVKIGDLIPATKEHTFGEWTSNKDSSSRCCTVCGFTETVEELPTGVSMRAVIILSATAVVIAGGVTATILIIKKNKPS